MRPRGCVVFLTCLGKPVLSSADCDWLIVFLFSLHATYGMQRLPLTFASDALTFACWERTDCKRTNIQTQLSNHKTTSIDYELVASSKYKPLMHTGGSLVTRSPLADINAHTSFRQVRLNQWIEYTHNQI